MTMLHTRGLLPKTSDVFHGLVMVRFASPLSRADQMRAGALLQEAGALEEVTPEMDIEERSLFVAGRYPGVEASRIDAVKDVLETLAAELGAVKAVFATVPTEIDALAVFRDACKDDEDEEEDEDEDKEDDAGEEVKSYWKAGPPPGVESLPFPLDRYPEILDVFDWEDFGIAVKLAQSEAPGERRLIEAVHGFWLAPYLDSQVAWPTEDGENEDEEEEDAEDGDGEEDEKDEKEEDNDALPPRPFRNRGVIFDPSHRSALLWVDGFAVPAQVADMVHHLLWVVAELHEVLPIAHARFDDATLEMKLSALHGEPGPHLVLAGNPVLTHFEREGEAAAFAWAETQGTFSPEEVAVMCVEVGARRDPEGEEADICLRFFDHALGLDPTNRQALANALVVLVIRKEVTEALRRASGNSDVEGYVLRLTMEHAPEHIGAVAHLLTHEALDEADAELLTPLVKAVANHAPEHLDALLVAVPEREESVGYLHDSMYGVTDKARQLRILLRVLELPLAESGPHRAGYLSAYNGACIIAHALKDYPLAVDLARRAAPHAEENPFIHHSAACAHAAVGDYASAFEHVKGAVRTHYEHLDRVEHDTDLGPILQWPEHKALFTDYRARLAKSEPIVEVTDDTFAQEVLAQERPVLVDFTAAWCGPCRRLAPILEALARESEGRYRVVKVDVDENAEVSQRYHIRNMPTLVVFSGGEERARQVGLTAKRGLMELLKAGGVVFA